MMKIKSNFKLMIIIFIFLSLTVLININKYTNGTSTTNAKDIFNVDNLNTVAIYNENESGEYERINEVPASGYRLNLEKSNCKVDGVKDTNIIIKHRGVKVSFDNLTKMETKCYLYFDKVDTLATKNAILTNMNTIDERTDFSIPFEANSTGTIYKAEDDDGETYYFAGNSTDNWVKFAGFYWRIIRINGDASVRMIYAGTEANATGAGTQISTSEFNPYSGGNMYVGYMYTSGQVHGLGTSSTIKGVLDAWFKNNLINYVDYVDPNAGFCGDRTPYSTTGGKGPTATSGTGTDTTYYGAYIRLFKSRSKSEAAPSFKCPESSDLYTLSESSKGNKALTYPVGLITADEVSYAGGAYEYNDNTQNRSYYLYTNQPYWTLTPWNHGGSYVYVLYMDAAGALTSAGSVSGVYGVRPVINLRAGTVFTSGGNGTTTNPYIVAGAE